MPAAKRPSTLHVLFDGGKVARKVLRNSSIVTFFLPTLTLVGRRRHLVGSWRLDVVMVIEVVLEMCFPSLLHFYIGSDIARASRYFSEAHQMALAQLAMLSREHPSSPSRYWKFESTMTDFDGVRYFRASDLSPTIYKPDKRRGPRRRTRYE